MQKIASKQILVLIGLIYLLSFAFYKPWEKAIIGGADDYSIHDGEINQWKEIGFFIPTKQLHLESTDRVSVYGWNTTNIKVCIDDLRLEWWGE